MNHRALRIILIVFILLLNISPLFSFIWNINIIKPITWGMLIWLSSPGVISIVVLWEIYTEKLKG